MRCVTYAALEEKQLLAGLRCSLKPTTYFITQLDHRLELHLRGPHNSVRGLCRTAGMVRCHIMGACRSAYFEGLIRAPASVCSVKQRVLLLRRGLTERVPRVRAAAARMLRTWLTDQCEDDVSSLLRMLDIEANEGAHVA